MADEDGEIRVQIFDVDLVDIGCDGRLEGLFILPSQLFGMHGGVGASDLGGMRAIRKDAEDVSGAVGLAKERIMQRERAASLCFFRKHRRR